MLLSLDGREIDVKESLRCYFWLYSRLFFFSFQILHIVAKGVRPLLVEFLLLLCAQERDGQLKQERGAGGTQHGTKGGGVAPIR